MKIRDITLCLVLSVLTACSGGGGGHDDDGGTTNGNNNGDNNNSGGGIGISTQATLSADNSKDAGLMASAAVKQAVANQSAPDAPTVAFKPGHSSDPEISRPRLNELAADTLNECSSGSVSRNGSTGTFNNCAVLSACSTGSFVVNGTVTGTGEAWEGDVTLAWNNCAFGFGASIFDGTEHVIKTNGGDSETTTYDLTITYPDLNQTYTTRGTQTCTGVLGDDRQCETTKAFEEFGQQYSLSNTDISGDGSSGYAVSTRVASDTLGYIDVTTTQPLLFSCDNGWPSAGVIQITAAGGTFATVTYTSCTSFTVNYNGVAISYDWSQF